MAQATAPILDSTSALKRCNAQVRELSEVQRTCGELRRVCRSDANVPTADSRRLRASSGYLDSEQFRSVPRTG